MTYDAGRMDAAAILKLFDRSSPEALLQSIASEFARLHQEIAGLTARVHAGEAMATLSDRIAKGLDPEIAADYPTSVRLDADQAFRDAVGFHRLEQDPKGRPYRWTGPEREFSFQLFVDRSRPAHFTLGFDNFYVPEPIDNLRCLVDGAPVKLDFERVDDLWCASGAAPVRPDRGGTAIVFVVPRVESPEDRGESDSRRLGLYYRWFEFETEPAA